MKISKADQSSLLIALTDGLQAARITSYGYISMPSDWEKSTNDSLDQDFAKKLRSVLDDGGLESLIQRDLLYDFFKADLQLPDKEKKSVALTSYSLFSDPLLVARRLVNVLLGMPFQYEAAVPACIGLAERLKDIDVDLKISERMFLKSGRLIASDFITHHEVPAIDARICLYQPKDSTLREIDPDGIYIVYRTSGIITDRYKPKPLSDFYDDIRAFYGATIAFDIFFYFSVLRSKPVAFLANQLSDNGRTICHYESADNDIAQASNLYSKKKTDSDIDQVKSLAEIFSRVIKLFNSKESQRLKTAAIWLLRSNMSSRGMDQVLDSTIAIEVLLGDREASDRVGLSKLMANRCAYSLGKSSSERQELYEFFIRFYKVRSDIVHSGRLKLSDGEAQVVDEGSKLASRILMHETDIS